MSGDRDEDGDEDGDGALTCSFCGRRSETPGETLTWSHAVENGRDVCFCARCSRDNLRAIEGKLDSEHW